MIKNQTFGDRMAVLKNARHEKFAVAVASGKSKSEAYREAGYKDGEHSRKAASRLATKVDVQDRAAGILAEVAAETQVTIAGLTTRLMRYADLGEAMADSAGLGVARASVMDAAKINGLVTDKTQVVQTIRNVVRADPQEAVAEWEADVADERGEVVN